MLTEKSMLITILINIYINRSSCSVVDRLNKDEKLVVKTINN